MVYNFFNQKTGSGISVNEQLAEKINGRVIEKLKKRKVYARFKDIIWKVDLVQMRSLSY